MQEAFTHERNVSDRYSEPDVMIGLCLVKSTRQIWVQLGCNKTSQGLLWTPKTGDRRRRFSHNYCAREAAEAFGADCWFSDPLAMIRDDRIDLITISVKVPAHRELVLAALNAGKAV